MHSYAFLTRQNTGVNYVIRGEGREWLLPIVGFIDAMHRANGRFRDFVQSGWNCHHWRQI